MLWIRRNRTDESSDAERRIEAKSQELKNLAELMVKPLVYLASTNMDVFKAYFEDNASRNEALAKSLEELRARVDSIEGLEERIKGLENSLKKLRSSLTALEDALKGLKAEVGELVEMRDELLLGLALRFRKEYECKYMDSEGYCTQWVSGERIGGFEMKCVSGMCYINVLKHKWVCALCPAYTPRSRSA